MAKVFHPKIKQGVAYRLVLKPRQSNGQPFDWTGYTFFSQIRVRPDSEAVAAAFAITPDQPELGALTLFLTAKQTFKLEIGTYEGFDVLVVDPSNEPLDLLEGKPCVRAGTTRVPGVNVDA